MKSGTETDASGAGQSLARMWVQQGKGGQGVGKWTGFSHFETALTHLFPHDSTQVVDFPRMYVVSIFRGRAKNSRISGRGMIGRGIGMKAKRSLEARWGGWEMECGSIGVLEGGEVGGKLLRVEGAPESDVNATLPSGKIRRAGGWRS